MVLTVEPLLGTRAQVEIVADPGVDSSAYEHAVVDEVRRLEQVFSVFDSSSALHDFRQTGITDVVELQAVIDLAAKWQRRTNGAFNPDAQPLVDLWDRAESRNELPSDNEIAAVTAALANERYTATLNLNAIAKGWIADHALTLAVAPGEEVTGGWIGLGGDIVHRGNGSVPVGIENPRRPYDNIAPMARVELCNESVATSGGARRWWQIGGRRFPKILDPRSGWPTERVASATIIAPDGATADALATIAVVMEPAETIELVKTCRADCFLVGHDGSVVSSSARFSPT